MSKNEKYFITINGEKIFVSQELYREYVRPEWRESKREERSKRCRGKDGHRCMNDCSKCRFFKTGSVLSLDSLEEDDGYQVASNEDVSEIVMCKLLLEALYAELARLAPTDRMIVDLFSVGQSERQISDALKERAQSDPNVQGLSQKSVNNRKRDIFAMLRERLEDYR